MAVFKVSIEVSGGRYLAWSSTEFPVVADGRRYPEIVLRRISQFLNSAEGRRVIWPEHHGGSGLRKQA